MQMELGFGSFVCVEEIVDCLPAQTTPDLFYTEVTHDRVSLDCKTDTMNCSNDLTAVTAAS